MFRLNLMSVRFGVTFQKVLNSLLSQEHDTFVIPLFDKTTAAFMKAIS